MAVFSGPRSLAFARQRWNRFSRTSPRRTARTSKTLSSALPWAPRPTTWTDSHRCLSKSNTTYHREASCLSCPCESCNARSLVTMAGARGAEDRANPDVEVGPHSGKAREAHSLTTGANDGPGRDEWARHVVGLLRAASSAQQCNSVRTLFVNGAATPQGVDAPPPHIVELAPWVGRPGRGDPLRPRHFRPRRRHRQKTSPPTPGASLTISVGPTSTETADVAGPILRNVKPHLHHDSGQRRNIKIGPFRFIRMRLYFLHRVLQSRARVSVPAARGPPS
mmetsp:Transcript_35771/g.114577  ORF Transcript_35771/g.114577 Transcript_35771/m.114577 type:complete len:279 (-) Transcript_35771:68-904(-)